MSGNREKSLPGGLTASFTVVDGPDRGLLKKMRQRRLVIGRKDGDLVLRDSKISAEHAVVEYQEGKFVLTDMSSTNGTFINDEQVRQRELRNLDEIRFGFSTVLFRIHHKQVAVTPRKATDSVETVRTEESAVSDMVSVGPEQVIAESPSPTLEIRLSVVTGPHRGLQLAMTKDTVVMGRVNCDLVLNDDEDVSRKHAVLEVLAGQQVFLRDLVSTNGTYLNENRVAHARVVDGDELRVGSTKIRVHVRNITS